MQGLFGSKFHKKEDAFSLRLNGFTKIGLCFVISIVTLIIDNTNALSILVVGSFIFAVSQIRFKVMFIVYLLVVLMSVFSMASAFGLSKLIGMGDYSLFTMIRPFMRILVVFQVLIVTALSTSPQEILINLKSIKLPRILYLPVLVMLRFVPSFINDLRQINESLKTRGLRITPISIIIHPILTMRCSVYPLIFRALRSSDELAIASELKGVGYYKNVTSFKKNYFKTEDFILIVIAGLFISSALWVYIESPKELSAREKMMQRRKTETETKEVVNDKAK